MCFFAFLHKLALILFAFPVYFLLELPILGATHVNIVSTIIYFLKAGITCYSEFLETVQGCCICFIMQRILSQEFLRTVGTVFASNFGTGQCRHMSGIQTLTQFTFKNTQS